MLNSKNRKGERESSVRCFTSLGNCGDHDPLSRRFHKLTSTSNLALAPGRVGRVGFLYKKAGLTLPLVRAAWASDCQPKSKQKTNKTKTIAKRKLIQWGLCTLEVLRSSVSSYVELH